MEELYTRWGRALDKTCPLNDYPRPQMERASFINLNGEWDYAIYKTGTEFSGYQGKITVPFSPECILSGVKRTVTPSDTLYYCRKFDFTRSKKRVLLHFGAVDYKCTVYLNGEKIGKHKGGYFPFSFEITDVLTDGENELALTVTDPSETGSQASGKQTSKRGNIWYTAQSGIWQTVWLEEVPQSYIESIKLTPDIDKGVLNTEIFADGEQQEIKCKIFDGEKLVAEKISTETKLEIGVPDIKLWSPENPFLYNMEISYGEDVVKTYFGMRKFSVGTDKNGTPRFMLNNEPCFMNGLLDQGYWSDGMYTAPSDEALIYDIKTMKEMGFNMLRKHIKIEPLRWYYHCDRLGMLVWQDMISGGTPAKAFTVAAFPGVGLAACTKKLGNLDDGEKNYALFSRSDKEGRHEYYTDAKRMIENLYNCVSICLWVPFNEGWGQFDALKACDFFKENDPTRLVDHASGWHDRGGGDVNSFHIYFTAFSFPKYSKKDNRVVALTEFGGYSMGIDSHRFNTDKIFGYRIYKSKDALQKALKHLYIDRVKPCIYSKGLSALVYTEVSDVEDETNGFLTYDREIVKVDIDFMKKINDEIKL